MSCLFLPRIAERDHPREYGENREKEAQASHEQGSSPRIRGESRVRRDAGNRTGIIPANTGRITVAAHDGSFAWDHPREYGENALSFPVFVVGQGSSPRIRGEWQELFLSAAPSGIIPANTGRICRTLRITSVMRDHPREYGENDFPKASLARRDGSSPRIRGECGNCWCRI